MTIQHRSSSDRARTVMEVSIPTLQFTDFLVFGSCGAIFLCNWVLNRRKIYFLCFGAGYVVCAGMAAWFVDFGAYGSLWSPIGWSLTGGAFWIGLRLFDGRPAVTQPMLVLFLLPTATHGVLSCAGFGPATINAGGTLAYALHEAAAALYVLRAPPARSPLRGLIALALLTIAVAICLPLLPLRETFVRLSIVGIFVVDQVTTILLTTSILALEAEKAHAAVEAMARTDGLTGALNRQGLAAKTSGGLGQAGIIVADLDHFKSINDRFGHAGGDAVLREFARRAGSLLPGDSHLARLGGEEFGIVLPGRDQRATARLAERLRHTIGSPPVLWKEATIPVTVSVGVAALAAGEVLHEALERADKALYAAKTEGRNRVRAA
ncbi:GGDEF domain-containing protein [Methylorubrum zatmanii]